VDEGKESPVIDFNSSSMTGKSIRETLSTKEERANVFFLAKAIVKTSFKMT
jgi:hypothetical protein